MLENCSPEGWPYMQQECMYSDGTCGVPPGDLITTDSPLCGSCAGTPNEFDGETNLALHVVFDRGGLLRAGAGAFLGTMMHDIFDGGRPLGARESPGEGDFWLQAMRPY
jgi:hypothetical protein